jgi:hypothetical protein
MKSRVAATTIIAAGLGPSIAAGIAHADPVVPQAGAVCSQAANSSMAMVGSQTFSPQHEVLLCASANPKPVWQHLDDIQRPATIWFTYGPDATLNTNDVASGSNWVGFGGKGCSVVQTSTDGGPPVTKTIQDVPAYTAFQVLPNVATLTLKGACQWRVAGNSPFGP